MLVKATHKYGLVISASSIVSNAECAIICSSYLCFRLLPSPATLPADPAPPAAPDALAVLPPLDAIFVVGIRDSSPPNIPPPPLLVEVASDAAPDAATLLNAVGENTPLLVGAEEEEVANEGAAVLGVISVS